MSAALTGWIEDLHGCFLKHLILFEMLITVQLLHNTTFALQQAMIQTTAGGFMVINRLFAALAISLGLVVSLPAAASIGFTGPWAPGTWATSFVGDVAPPGPVDNGSVNTAGAPNSITIIGGDDPSNPDGNFNSCVGGGLFGCEIRWSHVALGGPILFHWSYSTVDSCGAQCDLFGVLLNGVEQIVSDPGGLSPQSGTFSTGNTALSTFGFFVSTLDGAGGPATVVISEFQVVPEPDSIALLGLSLAALAMRRRSGGRIVA